MRQAPASRRLETHCEVLRRACTAEAIRLPRLPSGRRARLAWASDARMALGDYFAARDHREWRESQEVPWPDHY